MTDKAIMLIEDNPDDQTLTLRALRKNNIRNELVIVSDGAEALDYLFGEGKFEGRDLSNMPSLILLDLNLPKISGMEVLKKIRERPETKFLPVVILTSSKEDKDIMEGYLSGANSYVRKPIDFKEFIDAVQHLGLYWLILNEPAPIQMGKKND